MAPPKSIGELWFTADGLLSISAISYTKWYDKSCLQTMSCCLILWLSRAVPGQMLWWKVCQYRTTAVYTGVLKSQRERVACLRMRIKVPIVLVSSYDVQQKWSKAWEKVLSCIQSVGKKERVCRTEWHSGKNKIHLFVASSHIRISQNWMMERKWGLCCSSATTDGSHHVCSVQSDSFSTMTHFCILMKGCWIWQAKFSQSHIMFCKSCWLSIICIETRLPVWQKG